ncbi:MAG: septal ring lytic transglycosylase RlpA family protein [Myxococcales bacterium]|nr:septal ring lytic transglycosylase RlpA family protein [Myxococcales bacterium]
MGGRLTDSANDGPGRRGLRTSVVFVLVGAFVASCASSRHPSPATRPHTAAATTAGGERPASPEPERPEAPIEIREGRASYYSDRLAGRSTASGEPYDPRALTAASRDLPFGSLVRVHRLDGAGQSVASVTVRVNDRGPFRDHSRILDLSRAAAEALDMIRAGVIPIRAEILRIGR